MSRSNSASLRTSLGRSLRLTSRRLKRWLGGAHVRHELRHRADQQEQLPQRNQFSTCYLSETVTSMSGIYTEVYVPVCTREGRRGPSGPPRPFWLPVWDLAAQGTLPGRGSLHNYGFIYTTSLPNAQEGGPPFSKGAATPVRSFRVMGMRRVSVPKSIIQSEIRPKFVLRPPVGKWNEHACMLLSRDCARRTVRSPNQF